MSTDVGLVSRRPASEQGPTRDRVLLAVGTAVAAVAAIAYIVALATHPVSSTLKGFDLSVYLGGAGQALHNPGDLYTWTYQGHPGIQFTYTPFAALLFTLGRAVPFHALMGLIAVVSAYALLAAIWIAFRELGWRPAARAGMTLLLGGLVFWTEPVQRGIFLGQIDLVWIGLIVWDMCQADRRWWKGAATGLLAGINLIPALFVVYLLITRRFRQAFVAIGAFVVTVIIGFAVLPHSSVWYWLDGNFFQASRTGFVGDQQNQALRGMLTRLIGSVNGGQDPWLVIAIVVAVLLLASAVVLHNSGRTFAGLMVAALTALLVSPISWDHQWVWTAPGLALIIDAAVRAGRGSLARAWWYALAGVVLVAYAAWPDFWSKSAGLLQGGLINYAPASSFAHGDKPAYLEYHWHGLQLIAGNLYLLGGLGLCLVALVTTFLVARRNGGVAHLLRAQL
ncbi:MAG: glycosyltransferase 87 family protein [Trebonia sp.]